MGLPAQPSQPALRGGTHQTGFAFGECWHCGMEEAESQPARGLDTDSHTCAAGPVNSIRRPCHTRKRHRSRGGCLLAHAAVPEAQLRQAHQGAEIASARAVPSPNFLPCTTVSSLPYFPPLPVTHRRGSAGAARPGGWVGQSVTSRCGRRRVEGGFCSRVVAASTFRSRAATCHSACESDSLLLLIISPLLYSFLYGTFKDRTPTMQLYRLGHQRRVQSVALFPSLRTTDILSRLAYGVQRCGFLLTKLL